LYSRFKQVENKGVPHPLSGDYTPREQEDIDDSLYEYGKYGPQPQTPSPTVSNASSIVFSICPSNDCDGELGAVSNNSIPIPSIKQVTIATQKTLPQVPKPKQTVVPSCAQHVKTPRQPIRTPVTSSPTQQLNATIDSIEYTITEESVRRQLQLADASGINMLQNEEIFAGLQNIGPLLPAMLTIDAGQPQPSAAPTSSQLIPTPTPSHVQSTTPPPQPSSVQLTSSPPPTQPVQSTSSPPITTIPDTQPTHPPSPQI
ncbi:hypothetical protein Tco_0120460, partial [Tanacetum coccineum]